MSYSIKILSNQEFDKLPFEFASNALGLADVKNNSVYVRNTHVKELNRYLLDHELDHLVEETPTDEVGGVRYKFNFSNLFPKIVKQKGSIESSISPSLSDKYLSKAQTAKTNYIEGLKNKFPSVQQSGQIAQNVPFMPGFQTSMEYYHPQGWNSGTSLLTGGQQ